MSKYQSKSINGDGNQPVTQVEFSATMGAIKQDLDRIESRMATKDNLEQLRAETKAGFEQVRGEMATKAELAKLRQTTERILELIEGMDRKFKPLQDLPERMNRVERAIFS